MKLLGTVRESVEKKQCSDAACKRCMQQDVWFVKLLVRGPKSNKLLCFLEIEQKVGEVTVHR
jgi:hypothetical protein